VRCQACESQSLTSAQFCECCGGKLTARGPAAQPAGASAVALAATALDALIDGTAKQAPEVPPADEQTLWSQLMNTPAPPSVDSYVAPPVAAPIANSQPLLPPVNIADIVKANESIGVSIALEPAPVIAATVPAVSAVQTMVPPIAMSQSQVHSVPRAQVAPRPTAINNRSNTAASTERGSNRMLLAAAVVVAAASCAATYLLRIHQQPVIAHEQDVTSDAA